MLVVLGAVAFPLVGNRGCEILLVQAQDPVVEPSDALVGAVGQASLLNRCLVAAQHAADLSPPLDAPVRRQPLRRVAHHREPVVDGGDAEQFELDGRYVLRLVHDDMPVFRRDGSVQEVVKVGQRAFVRIVESVGQPALRRFPQRRGVVIGESASDGTRQTLVIGQQVGVFAPQVHSGPRLVRPVGYLSPGLSAAAEFLESVLVLPPNACASLASRQFRNAVYEL